MAPVDQRTIQTRPSKWRDTVLVCKKCTKKLKGGFGASGRTPLRRTLRAALGLKSGRRASLGVLEVPCFKLCPKKAVAVALGSQPRQLYVIPRRTKVADVLSALNLPANDA